MHLEGSCQCGKVCFRVDSQTPYPYQFCYCSICRKTSGALTCNIMGQRKTLRVTGKKHLRRYHGVMRRRGRPPTRSTAERWFCGLCGSHLYLLDDEWPDGVWPNAAAIDTPLPVPPEHVQLMLQYKPAWVPTVDDGSRYEEYPELSIADWHTQHRRIAPVRRARSAKPKSRPRRTRS